MDQLPPHDERAWQSFEPGTLGHRSDPLRHSQHRFAFLPLISGGWRQISAGRMTV
ncbi:hypothetical protein N7E02_24595 [Aliirhizobium terrae]|nr:hypothetical protein [Rhizobium sp. CC-CFT758]WJH42316.1 hypothetical protein N7E02_24595 [Rhizobium sp. CC-CFT758]